MPTISSAVPSDLERYARATRSASALLEAEARRLEAACARFSTRCTEYRVPQADGLAARVFLVARHTEELGIWVEGAAVAFRQADTGAVGAPQPALGGLFSVLGAANAQYGPDAALVLLYEALWLQNPARTGGQQNFDQVSKQRTWNGLAASLDLLLGSVEGTLTVAGPLWPLAVPLLVTALGPALVVCGLGAVGLSIVGDAPHWAFQPVGGPDDRFDLIQRSFWNQGFQAADPLLLRRVAARVDALNLLLSGQPAASTGKPPSERTRFNPLGATVSDAYSAISYAPDEQVVLERLNDDGEYRISFAGLDPSKPGAPNNFEAVIITGYFPPEQNAYYQHARERFFAALKQIPPGSELHMQGHSMGGGVALLLREDPEVQRRLREANISVPSLTLYGAVVPTQVQFQPVLPADSPFASTELRAFVHQSDSLARNVGAGYEGYAAVQLIGGSVVDAPAHAHTDYGKQEHYAGVPGELTLLPYEIDPAYYERTVPGILPAPIEPIELPPIPLAWV